MLQQLRPTANSCFTVYTDNTTTEAVITNKKSKHHLVNDGWKLIQKLLKNLNCTIVAKRVTSGENDADNLSRGLENGRPANLEVLIELPTDLKSLLERGL